MMKKRETSAHVGFSGGSMLIVILAVLCLVIFAAASLSAASANGRLSEAYADGVTEYYTADAKAQKIIADIRSGNIPENVSVTEDAYIFSVPVGETRELQVVFSLTPEGYSINRYSVVYVGEWSPSGGMTLMKSESKE